MTDGETVKSGVKPILVHYTQPSNLITCPRKAPMKVLTLFLI